MIITIIILIIVLVVIGYTIRRLVKKIKRLDSELKQSDSKIRSLFVKFGKTFEHFAPLTKNFPADKEKTVFLGMPIDFICFEDDKILFVEIKTGDSQLSPKQKSIKKLIEERKVEFIELRFQDGKDIQ